MKCIFCKKCSQASRSVEHIIPESFGSPDHILPRGHVCDGCNNYLARKVEAPFLESSYGTQIRYLMRVANKRNRIPNGFGVHLATGTRLNLQYCKDSHIAAPESAEDQQKFLQYLKNESGGRLYLPVPTQPETGHVLSRFIGKIGMEVLAYRLQGVEASNSFLVNCSGLDLLRSYVREGKGESPWPIHTRVLHPPWAKFSDKRDPCFEVLNEFTGLLIPNELGEGYYCTYAVVALFGVEYVINLGGPSVDSYVDWLKRNNNKSPLYMEEDPPEIVAYFDKS